MHKLQGGDFRTMDFKLEPYHRNVPESELIDDLLRVAKQLGKQTVTMEQYNEHGKFHSTTVTRHFSSWFIALQKAGLEKSRSPFNIPNEELFRNLEEVWIQLGRQPRYVEMRHPLSAYSVGTYEKRFGGWRVALEAFIAYINSVADNAAIPIVEAIAEQSTATTTSQAKTDQENDVGRAVPNGTRFRVFLRDGFRCQSCGQSPITNPGIELHADHILPWSKGGRTIVANLRTLCAACNLGKGATVEDQSVEK